MDSRKSHQIGGLASRCSLVLAERHNDGSVARRNGVVGDSRERIIDWSTKYGNCGRPYRHSSNDGCKTGRGVLEKHIAATYCL